MKLNAEGLFQFHEGPIKTCFPRSLSCTETCFNSMKVRLKLFLLMLLIFFSLFQFHEGPIKTGKLI